MLATFSVAQRVTISFRGGPLAGIMLDSQSANEAEREDVAWLLVQTRGGELGARFRATDRLRTQGGRASAGEYEIRSRTRTGEESRLFLVYNAPQSATADSPRE
jgi:hypothetical protein